MKLQRGRSLDFGLQEDEDMHFVPRDNSQSRDVEKPSRYSGQAKQSSLSTCRPHINVIVGGKAAKEIRAR